MQLSREAWSSEREIVYSHLIYLSGLSMLYITLLRIAFEIYNKSITQTTKKLSWSIDCIVYHIVYRRPTIVATIKLGQREDEGTNSGCTVT
jgi:hypothetical protein